MTVTDRGADASAPRSTPLTLVAGAVAGDTLESVAASVADALGCPVAIAIPAHGPPVVSPPGALTEEAIAAIDDTVPVRIAEQVVGIVAAGAGGTSAERRAWLEAAAAAASVTALIKDAPGPDSRAAVVGDVAAGPPSDLPGVLARARWLGVDLSAGGVALCAAPTPAPEPAAQPAPQPAARPADGPAAVNGDGVLIAELRPGRLVAVCPSADQLAGLAAALRADGRPVAISSPRRDPALLYEAIREAELLAELGGAEDAPSGRNGETYRLLIGVLLRDRAELTHLRDSTVSSLANYDARHDADLLDTLRAFLCHDGSTTDTAEALQLHRHTVGYRLSRVHEVSGLSPYESDGRERLSLGLKAHQILDVERRLEAS